MMLFIPRERGITLDSIECIHMVTYSRNSVVNELALTALHKLKLLYLCFKVILHICSQLIYFILVEGKTNQKSGISVWVEYRD